MKRTARRAAVPAAVLLLMGMLAASAALAEGPLFMWRVSSETATVTMVGSIHVGKADFFPLAAPYEEAFAAAPVLAVEVDAGSPANLQKAAALVMQKGMLPGATTLQDRLEPELWARLEAYAAERGSPLAMYGKFHPGIVAMLLTMEEYQRQGFDPELGIDKHFLDAARESGKEIRELETLEDQLDLFLAIDDELDDILMAEMLDQMDDVEGMAREMIELWRAGDVAGLDDFLQDQVGDDPRMEAFYRTLLDDRNVDMAERIDALLKGDEDVFVVVGAGHFAGKMGLPSLLTAKGWQIEQVSR